MYYKNAKYTLCFYLYLFLCRLRTPVLEAQIYGNFNHSMFLQFVSFIYLGTNVENKFDVRRIPHFWRRVWRPEYWPENVANSYLSTILGGGGAGGGWWCWYGSRNIYVECFLLEYPYVFLYF
jgi:hypothetical protein